HCDEGHGDMLKDSSGNERHGKISGAKWVNADDSPIVADDPQRRAAEGDAGPSDKDQGKVFEWIIAQGAKPKFHPGGRVEVDLGGKPVADVDLAQFKALPSLVALSLRATPI